MKKSTQSAPAGTADEYLSQVPEEFRTVLEKLRQTIRSAAPEAEEIISYGMPAYRDHGPLVFFGAFAKHCSFFPGSSQVRAEFATELAGFKTAKGTVQFTLQHPLPAGLVRKIVQTRVRENRELAAARSERKAGGATRKKKLPAKG